MRRIASPAYAAFRPRWFIGLMLFLSCGLTHAGEKAEVVRVIDGDSLVLRVAGRSQECRLIGVDAPEWNQDPWGKRARRHLISLVENSGNRLAVEMDLEESDKYGRLLVYLRDGNDRLVNLRMVEDGFAYTLNKPPNQRYASMLRKAEYKARSGRLGIWGEDGPKERPGRFREKNSKITQ